MHFDERVVTGEGLPKVKRPTRNELLEALAEAENALLDYVDRLEKQGGSMNYGRAVIRKIQNVQRRETFHR
jgi:hypothetical protein